MARPSPAPFQPQQYMSWLTVRGLVQMAIFCIVNVLALVHWGHPELWSRLDRFSVMAIALQVGLVSMTRRVRGALSGDAGEEFNGLRFDPLFLRMQRVRRLVDLLTFVDYGQGLMFPAVALPAVQVAGLVLGPAALLWLWRVDSYIIAHFPA